METMEKTLFDSNLDAQKALKELRLLLDPIPVLNIEGNWNEDRLAIGLRAGPSVEIDNALHEIGHLITSDDRRVNQPSWGLRYKKWVSCPWDRYSGGYYDVRTCQDVKLEARVFAAQVVIKEKIGYEGENILEFIKSARYLAGFCYIPQATTIMESIRAFTEVMDQDQKRIQTIFDWVLEMSTQKEFSADAIVTELHRKKSLVVKRQARKDREAKKKAQAA